MSHFKLLYFIFIVEFLVMAQYQMSAMDKEKLVKNRIYLLDNLVPSEKLLSYLFEKMVLTENMYQEIKVSTHEFLSGHF